MEIENDEAKVTEQKRTLNMKKLWMISGLYIFFTMIDLCVTFWLAQTHNLIEFNPLTNFYVRSWIYPFVKVGFTGLGIWYFIHLGKREFRVARIAFLVLCILSGIVAGWQIWQVILFNL